MITDHTHLACPLHLLLVAILFLHISHHHLNSYSTPSTPTQHPPCHLPITISTPTPLHLPTQPLLYQYGHLLYTSPIHNPSLTILPGPDHTSRRQYWPSLRAMVCTFGHQKRPRRYRRQRRFLRRRDYGRH